MDFLGWGTRAATPPAPPKTRPLPILPLVSLESLTRWSDEVVPAYETDAIASTSTAAAASSASGEVSSIASPSAPPVVSPSGSIQFAVAPSLNRKLILVQGDLVGLKVDACVVSTNERLSDLHHTAYGSRLVAYAGPSLGEEIAGLVRAEHGVGTGDAALLSSHALGKVHGGASHIIAAVSPKYVPKYKTAADNALHGCVRRAMEVLLDGQLHSIAFPLIATPRKGFPPASAAHIVLRTLRKFLDRYGERTLTSVVLCFQEKPEEAAVHGAPAIAPMVAAVPSASQYPGAAAAPARPVAASSIDPLSIDETSSFELYRRLMPLYFPRSDAEAQLQLTQLPRDTGNELGETVVEERRIRVAYGQFISSGPRPFEPSSQTPLDHDHTLIEGGATSTREPVGERKATNHSRTSSTAAPSSSASSSYPTATPFLPSKTEYVPAEEMPREPAPSSSSAASSSASAGLPRTHDIVPSAEPGSFTAASTHPDEARRCAAIAVTGGVPLTPQELEEERQESWDYFQHLKRAQGCRHEDMALLDQAHYTVDTGRKDVLNRRIIQVIGSRVPLWNEDGSARVSREHFSDHALRTLDALTLHPFVAIYFHADVAACNRIDAAWFREMYTRFTRGQKANLRKLIVVHPTLYLRSAMYVLASFLPKPFWSQLVYVHKLTDLEEHIDAKSLSIPRHVLLYDRKWNGPSALTTALLRQTEDDAAGL